MLVDEIQQGATPEVLKYVLGGIGLLLSNALTYWLSRPKNKSEVGKNVAEALKSEAEAVKSRVETISLLLKEVDEMIVTTKHLRTEIEVRVEERMKAVTILNKTLAEAEDLIDLTVTTGAVQVVRMKLVGIKERLHKLHDILEIKNA